MSVVEHSSPRVMPAPKARGHGSMSSAEALRVALQGLMANKLRSFLTMLGIIIGVGAVIIMVALGQGVANATRQAISKLGTNVLTVMPQAMMRGGVSQGLGSQQTLKLSDADYVRKHCPSVKSVTAEYNGSGTVKYADKNEKTTIEGCEPDYFDMRNMPIATGKIFSANDVKRRTKVAVIGDTVRDELFGDQPAVGKTIKVNGQNFTVIGVTQPRGGTGWRNPDDQVTVPITTAMMRLFGETKGTIKMMSVQSYTEGQMHTAEDEVTEALTKAHKIREGEDPDVKVWNQADLLQSATAQSTFLTMLLAGIALVSLIVGGIGIMNIMLVSVTERTREIGIRKAIGAKRKDILYQFLIESVTLALVGGLIGIGTGVGVSLWMGAPQSAGGIGFPMQLSAPPIIISFCFSALVGVFFGIYPAMKASRLDPIEALRYE